MDKHLPRRRLFDRPTPGNDNSQSSDGDDLLTPRSIKSPSSFGTSRSSRNENKDGRISSHNPISAAFQELKDLNFGKGSPPVYYTEVLHSPDTQFDKIIQKAKEFLAEVQYAINRLKNDKDTSVNLLDTESQIEKTIVEVNKIAVQLQNYIDETATRRANDVAVSPRVVNQIKSREGALNELLKVIKTCKKELQVALAVRERKELLNEWSPFDRLARTQRDAEEMISDSTERLMNSKRILLETIQASSGTLGSLATSSQSIQKNDEELGTQGYMVSSARSLLQKYGRRASTDKISIWLGFIFFGFCALYVAYKRLF